MAEFATRRRLVAGAPNGRTTAGYAKMDAYSPFPIHELAEALGVARHRGCRCIVLARRHHRAASAASACRYWVSAIDYPLNIGGRPFNSWPAFIPVTFELTILLASFTAVFGMLALNGLPQPYHPVFNVHALRAVASQDGFFLAIEATDPKFDSTQTRALPAGPRREGHR